MRAASLHRQRGAVAIIVGLCIIALLAVLGLVLDLGHLYIVKGELQNSADACALAAARELNDLSTGATERAKAAGITAGSRNRMDMQSATVPLGVADITFSASIEGPWNATVDNSTVYARCAPYESVPYSVVNWVGHWGDTTAMRVYAYAVARPLNSQSYCAVPLAICDDQGGAGLTKGHWYNGRLGSGSGTSGLYGWVLFPGMSGASDMADIIAGPGVCNLDAKEVDAQGGVDQSVARAWNTRFGLYTGSYNYTDNPPDRVGYAYTKDHYTQKNDGVLPGSWPYLVTSPAPPLPTATYPLRAASNAFDGTTFTNPAGSAWTGSIGPNYSARKSAALDDPPDITLLPYDPHALLDDKGRTVDLPGHPNPLSGALHAKGQDRRLVFMPIIKCSDWPVRHHIQIQDYACALLLHPMSDPDTDVEIEYRGRVKDTATGNDCGTTGTPGEFGPPVPALVR